MALETTLILLKPDAVAKGIIGTMIERFEQAGFRIRGMKMERLSDELLAEHYAHVADQPFFPRLRMFMQEAPVVILALEAESAIARMRRLLGPTDSLKADPGTIRGDFGAKDANSKMRNVCHASDGAENAAVELKRFFDDTELF